MKLFFVFVLFFTQVCFYFSNGNQLENNENKNKSVFQSKDVYEMRYVCYIVIGINIVGGLIFLAFGRSFDPKNKSEFSNNKLTNVKVTQIDAM